MGFAFQPVAAVFGRFGILIKLVKVAFIRLVYYS